MATSSCKLSETFYEYSACFPDRFRDFCEQGFRDDVPPEAPRRIWTTAMQVFAQSHAQSHEQFHANLHAHMHVQALLQATAQLEVSLNSGKVNGRRK